MTQTKEQHREYMREYRQHHKGDVLRQRNRLGFLEHEVQRLTRALDKVLTVAS